MYTLKTIAIGTILALSLNSCSQSKGSENTTDSTETATVKAPKIAITDAVVAGDIGAVRQHIAAKSDLNKKDPFGGSTPIMIAAVFDKTEIAKELLDAGVELDLTNNEGSTAVITAAFFCRTEILQMLLDAGADKSIRNKYGTTALESAQVPFEDVKGIYDIMSAQLKGMGLQLDMERIEKTRPQIAEMLK
ncbi:MAG: ankyrin repeat domain-containing protein [Cytophagia bacterium]|nr:ankyrin repeat domain-containing protein [Cytophagia bacterium]